MSSMQRCYDICTIGNHGYLIFTLYCGFMFSILYLVIFNQKFDPNYLELTIICFIFLISIISYVCRMLYLTIFFYANNESFSSNDENV